MTVIKSDCTPALASYTAFRYSAPPSPSVDPSLHLSAYPLQSTRRTYRCPS